MVYSTAPTLIKMPFKARYGVFQTHFWKKKHPRESFLKTNTFIQDSGDFTLIHCYGSGTVHFFSLKVVNIEVIIGL